jgi:hypothetical protein
MTTSRYPPWRAGWIMSILASLCMTLLPWLGHGDPGHVAEAQRDITVHQGRLSVHLQEADVRDVLTAIGQQAGITILADLRPGIRVSTHFSGMVLDEGLRHLLRRASLSSTMVYTRGPAWAVMLTAVYVFEEATGPAPHSQLAAEPPTEDGREEGGISFAEALAQLSSAVPPLSEVGKNNGAARCRALLKSAQHIASPPPGAGEESALARRLREALEQPLQPPDETSPHDLPQREYRE